MENETVTTVPSDENKEKEKDSTKNAQATEEAKENSTSKNKETSKEENGPKKDTTKTPSSGKVKVHFVAVGSAPLMKKTKFQINSDQRFSAVISFLRKMLKLKSESLFLYCNSAFVPSPDQLVGELNDAFSVRGELVLHYSLQEAWG